MITLSEKLIWAAFRDALGWTLLHALWQIAVVALLLYFVLSWGKSLQANLRYAWAVGALSMVTLLALTTFTYEYLAERPVTLTVSTAQKPAYEALKLPAQKMANRTVHPTTEKRLSMDILAQAAERHMTTLVLVWMGGVMLLSLRWLGGFVFVQRLKRRPDNLPLDDWQAKVQGLAVRIGLSRSVQVIASAWAKVPMVIGHLKPVILLPASLVASLPPEQLEAIVAHELAHIYRKDYWINLLQSVVEIIFFFHPAIWWMAKVIRTEREHCCDDMAVCLCGNTLTYAKALAQVAENRHRALSLAMAASGRGSLLQRIERLLSPGSHRTQLPARYVWLTLALLTMVAVSASMAYKISDGGFSNMLYSSAGKPSVGRVVLSDTKASAAQQIIMHSDTVKPASPDRPADTSAPSGKDKPRARSQVSADTVAGGFYFHFSDDSTKNFQFHFNEMDTGFVFFHSLPNLDTLWPDPILPNLDSLWQLYGVGIDSILQKQPFWQDTLMQNLVQQVEERTHQLQSHIEEQRPQYDSLAARIARQQMIQQQTLLEAQIKLLERQAAELERQMKAYERNANQQIEMLKKETKKYKEEINRAAEAPQRKASENEKRLAPQPQPFEDEGWFDQIEQEMLEDKLIEKDKKYYVDVTADQFIINGKKQSKKTTKKYRALFLEAVLKPVKV